MWCERAPRPDTTLAHAGAAPAGIEVLPIRTVTDLSWQFWQHFQEHRGRNWCLTITRQSRASTSLIKGALGQVANSRVAAHLSNAGAARRGRITIICQGLYFMRKCLTMRPSRASTSLTRVPLARPPMLGLQLISPMLPPGEGVTRSVCAPLLAAAAAASQPAHAQEAVP